MFSFPFPSLSHLPKTSLPLPFPFKPSTMLPSQGDNSSRRKRKEAVANDLPAKIVGREAPHSESDRFEEEEGGRDPSSECPPLIDPWYDTYIHFPVVPSDCSPLPLGCVWLSICCHDTEVSWTLLASTILTLISTKEPHYPCLFSTNLGQVRLWVAKNGWTWSCPIWVSWRCYSKPACWRPLFLPYVCPTIRICSTSAIWSVDV